MNARHAYGVFHLLQVVNVVECRVFEREDRNGLERIAF